MAEMTIYDLLWAYQENQQIAMRSVPDLIGDAHAYCVVILEMVRECKATFETPEAYNASTDEAVLAASERAVARARLHPTARLDLLQEGQIRLAAGVGESIFEHGYEDWLASEAQQDHYPFRSQGE